MSGPWTSPRAGGCGSVVLVDEPPWIDGRRDPSFLDEGNGAVDDDGGVTADDRAWGLAPPRDYAEILAATFERDYRPRFAARGIDAAPAWAARRALPHQTLPHH